MKHGLSALAGILASVLAIPAAFAQDFGKQGDFHFGAERLLGIYFIDDGFGDGSIVAFGANPSPYNPAYTTARFAFDYFVIDGLNIGGSFGFWFYNDRDDDGPDDDLSGFLLAPRVGYAFHFTPKFGIWPRGGMTFWNMDIDDEIDLTLEAAFFYTPTEHFGFTLGPVFDLGLAGEGDEGLSFGLLAGGLFGWL